MPVKAISKNVGASPKRLRRYIEAVRGKRVQQALDMLRFMPSPAGEQVAKTLRSAAANAENNLALNPDRLQVVRAYVDQAPVLKRFRAKARGRVGRVTRRSSHITIIVDEEGS